ncbi:MAG: EAL domain-containing protein [Spirochaetia bacterium]|nr:EAL domain-containing protein [Spirochaetia bacterium]MCF7940914.1 EAL domain-containing protein [Spirochaetia bacterium]
MTGFFISTGQLSLLLFACVVTAMTAWYCARKRYLKRYDQVIRENEHNLAVSLAAERQLYTSLLEHTTDGVVLMDMDYTIREVNSSFLKMFEFAEGELNGKPLYQYILSDVSCPNYTTHEALIKSDNDSYETIRIKQNGDPVIVKVVTFTVSMPTLEGEKHVICSQYTDVTEMVQKEQKISELAYYDSLTGLPNRYLLKSKAAEIQMDGRDTQFSFVFMDLNGFKHINDTLGHEYGDALLIAFSKRVRGNIKRHDFLARIGGDEFVLLLPNTPRKMAYRVVERIHQVLENPFMINGQRLFIGAAAGITGYPEDSHSVKELQRFADIAMYTAKKQHVPYRYYSKEMSKQYNERLQLEQSLSAALKRPHEILLHYLPVIDLEDFSVLSFEALCRWDHPEQGLISSAKFIQIAEDSQLIYDLGTLVLKKAFKQAYRWKQAGYDFTVTVNLSAKELVLPGTIGKLRRLLKQYPGVEHQVELEITEAVSMLNLEKGKESVRQLKDLGFSIILDDFGSGYSSLTFLRELEVDRLKIDKHLIEDARYSNATGLILKGLHHLASIMDVDIIAEGVSTIEQRQLLESIGFRYLQGFLFSEPVPAQEIDQVLARLAQSKHFLQHSQRNESKLHKVKA